MSKKPNPECLALLICEGVVEDARSHNKTILNTYNRIVSHHYPARHDRLAIFLSLTNGHGECGLVIRIVRTDAEPGQPPLVAMQGEVRFSNPLDVTELTVDLRGLVIPAAGSYAIEVECDGVPLKQRRFQAVRQESGGVET